LKKLYARHCSWPCHSLQSGRRVRQCDGTMGHWSTQLSTCIPSHMCCWDLCHLRGGPNKNKYVVLRVCCVSSTQFCDILGIPGVADGRLYCHIFCLMRVSPVDDLAVTNVVDLYNSVTGLWSTSQLSVARNTLAATSVGKFAIFAGGITSGVLCCAAITTESAIMNIACFCLLWFHLPRSHARHSSSSTLPQF